MVAPRTLLLVLVLTTLPACFQPGELERSDPAPHALALRDPEGAQFSSEQAPRDLELRLAFEAGPPAHAEPSLLLVRGAFHPGFMARLSAARLRSVMMPRTVPLTLAREGHELIASPGHALEPGRYTLLWTDPEEPAAFGISVSASPSLGARLVETWPGDGELAAPRALARALLRFDGQLAGAPTLALLRDQQGAALEVALELAPCDALGFGQGDCLSVLPRAPLAPGARYELAVTEGLHTLTGAPIAAASAWFTVSTREDREPPTLIASPCALDELAVAALCVRPDDATFRVRGTVDEAAWLSLTFEADGAVRTVSALSYANTFELAATASTSAADVRLQARDLAGNVREQALSATASSDLPTVSIEEVRADPLGKEPAQEYVELLNFGAQPVALMGFKLSKDAFEVGRSLIGASVLAAGERALVVGPDFDPRDLSDGALPSAIKLVRSDGALSLANHGASLFLRDGEGRRVSAASALAPLVEGQCSARAVADRRRGGPEAFELDPDGGCTPGAATFDRL